METTIDGLERDNGKEDGNYYRCRYVCICIYISSFHFLFHYPNISPT